MVLRNAILSALLFISFSSKAQNNFEIRYLGNMGIAIIHHDSTFIIDGLHDFYGTDYLPTDSAAIKAIMERKDPFKKIVAIAITHKHGDHFDSSLVTDAANIHASAVFIGGAQTIGLLGNTIQKRLKPLADSLTIIITPNLSVNIQRIAHINPARHSSVENYRMEVVWDKVRIVHFGDAAVLSEAIKELKPSPDIVIIPNWFLTTDGLAILQKISPVKIIVTHIAPSDPGTRNSDESASKIIPFKIYGDKLKANR